ncbi:DDE-type integrase/transposase/recombinase [Belnapia moabensis]|uniref:DDE-type integrase/transposase/recombinase n=1 Tax=Belnapia moabensis TaxID=365533 RepID=UPI0012EE9A27
MLMQGCQGIRNIDRLLVLLQTGAEAERPRPLEPKQVTSCAQHASGRQQTKKRSCSDEIKTYLKVRGQWCDLYRAIDRNGDLVDTMLSEHRDMAAAQAFLYSAKSVTGRVPDQEAKDEHGSYPRAIWSTLSRRVVPPTSAHNNNRLEQDNHGVKGRIRCMGGFKSVESAHRFAEAMANSASPPPSSPQQPAHLCQPLTPTLPPSCRQSACHSPGSVDGARPPTHDAQFGVSDDRTGRTANPTGWSALE